MLLCRITGTLVLGVCGFVCTPVYVYIHKYTCVCMFIFDLAIQLLVSDFLSYFFLYQVAFTGNYNEYFGFATDVDAVVYLMLVNDLIHGLFPEAISIGEDVCIFSQSTVYFVRSLIFFQFMSNQQVAYI